MLKCGASEIVITPELGVSIPGYFTGRPATGKKDDLYAHALVLNDEKTTIALISLDIIGMTEKMADAIRTRVNELTGIEKETRESIFRALRAAFREDETAETETGREGFPG